MKRLCRAGITAALLCVVVLGAASCSAVSEAIDLINELAAAAASTQAIPKPDVSLVPSGVGPAPAGRIPFSHAPEIVPCELPAEQIDDPLEAEASKTIDAAIARAISYVSAMKDGRHGMGCIPFEEDANGYLAKLDAEEKRAYDLIVDAGKRAEHIRLSEKEYPGDLKKLFFALYEPMTYCEPGLASYLTLDVDSYLLASDLSSHYRSIFDRYFDPDRDANVDLSTGGTSMEKIMHDAELLDRVVKRVVRFMPEGLSAYDRYYYLAAVLSEQVSYDKRPDNCFTAYGALIGGRAVCEGYTSAYYLLCRQAGLWCAYRNGLPEGQGHTWNMVKLDSGIYNVDVTWCDGYGEPFDRDWYDCFMKSDQSFEDDGHRATSGVEGTGGFEPCPYEAER